MTCECSGFQLLPYYSTEIRDTGRRWIDGQDIIELVVSGIPPAPGQTVLLRIPFNNCALIKSQFHIGSFGDAGYFNFSMPIPHHGSGLANSMANGTWTIYFDNPLGNEGFYITASSEAFDFASDPGYLVYGVVELINI